MNFFQSLSALQLQGDWNITVKTAEENTLVVSVLLNNVKCGDDAKKLIPPLILKGTAMEMDSGFFESVTTPMQTTSSLLTNMEAFLKQQELAKQQSAMVKEKHDKQKKDQDAKDKKFSEAMKGSDELANAGKYREAWTKLPDPALFPEKAELIKKRRSELSAKFAPDLFATPIEEHPIIEFEILETLSDDENEDEFDDAFDPQDEFEY